MSGINAHVQHSAIGTQYKNKKDYESFQTILNSKQLTCKEVQQTKLLETQRF